MAPGRKTSHAIAPVRLDFSWAEMLRVLNRNAPEGI